MVTAIRRRCSSCERSPPSKLERREVEQSQHAGAGMADHSSGDREVVVVVVDACGDRLQDWDP